MTNSLLRSALKRVVPLTLAAVVGCGPSDGKKELADGLAALEARDPAKAVKALEKSLACDGQTVDALVGLARAKLALGELKAAGEAVTAAAAQEPAATDVLQLQAQLAYHGKDYSAANEFYGKLANDTSLSAEVRAEGWTGLGIVALTQNMPDVAHAAFLTAIRLDRRHASAYYHLGLLYRNSYGLSEAALEQFEKFAYLGDAGDVLVRKVHRVVLPEIKDTIAHAAKSRLGASRRDTAACSSLLAKAEAAMRKGGAKGAKSAVSFYQQALQADALSYPAALGLAKAWPKAEAGRAGEARSLECYKLACALKPSAVQTLLAAGQLAAQRGLQAVAAEIYLRAVAADGTNISAIDGLIRALQRTGKRKEAKAYQDYRDLLSPKRK